MQGDSSPSLHGRNKSQRTAKSRLCADLRNDELSVQERHVIRVSAQSRGKTHAKCWEGIYYIGGRGVSGDKHIVKVTRHDRHDQTKGKEQGNS